MLITKSEDVKKEGFCTNYTLRKTPSSEKSLIIYYWSFCGSEWAGVRGCLFQAGRLLIFSAFRMGAYSRWVLIRGWVLIRINTVYQRF